MAIGSRGWRLLRGALAAAVLSCAGSPAVGSEVAVLVERGASIYQQAAQGFEQSFGDRQAQVLRLDASDPHDLKMRLAVLRGSRPRLVVAIGTQVARAAREQLPGLPILYCLVLRPAQNGLVGDDIGGVAFDVELPQQLSSIQDALPQVRRIGVIYDELTSGEMVRRAQQYLKPGVRLVSRDARTPRDAARIVEELLGQVDAFWLLWDPVILNPANFKLLVDASLKNKVALVAPARPFVEAGALMSVGADYFQAGRRTAEMAQQVLGGRSRAGQFVAEPPGPPVLTINGQVAKRLGISIPREVRAEILSP